MRRFECVERQVNKIGRRYSSLPNQALPAYEFLDGKKQLSI